MTDLGYRQNVGAAIFNARGLVFLGRRAGLQGAAHVWQMPQGGIDPGEDPRAAVLREVAEETGITSAQIIAEHGEWLQYDLPPELLGRVLGGRYRGQRQRWFALRFIGPDSEIRLDAHGTPEFDQWRWARLAEVAELAVPFKRDVYAAVAASFKYITEP